MPELRTNNKGWLSTGGQSEGSLLQEMQGQHLKIKMKNENIKNKNFRIVREAKSLFFHFNF